MAAYNTLHDLELSVLLREGNHAAFEEIYKRYFGLLYVHAFNKLKDQDEAKDAVQELFAGLWSKRAALDLKTNISNYLYTAVRNRVLDVIAHKQVESKYISALPDYIDMDTCLPDHRLRERELAAIIEKEIQALPPKMREVFELSRKHNLTHKQIAEQLGITEQSVRSHVKNALKIIRSRVGILAYLLYLWLR